MRLLLVTIMLLVILGGELKAQDKIIDCTNLTECNIIAGETVKCQFAFDGRVKNFTCSPADLQILEKNIGNSSPKEVTIQFGDPGFYPVEFRFERNGNKVFKYNVTFKVGLPNSVIAAEIAHSDCTGESGAIDLSIDNINSNIEIESFSWTGPNGYSKEGSEDIINLKSGLYTVTVKYDYAGYFTSSINKTFEVKQLNDLEVNILDTEGTACSGDLLYLSTETKGGIDDKTYSWIITEGADTNTIIGASTSFEVPLDFTGNKKVRLKVQSGVCVKESKPINVNIHKKIKTNTITHKKEKKE